MRLEDFEHDAYQCTAATSAIASLLQSTRSVRRIAALESLDVTMPHPKKIVLHCRNGYSPRLDSLVEEFIRDGVIFVGVVGADCAKVEDMIDEIVVAHGSREYHLLTSNHAGESVEGAVRFADSLTGEFEGEAHVIVV